MIFHSAARIQFFSLACWATLSLGQAACRERERENLQVDLKPTCFSKFSCFAVFRASGFARLRFEGLELWGSFDHGFRGLGFRGLGFRVSFLLFLRVHTCI